MSDSKVKLVWNGPDSTINLDVAAETGDAQLLPGREIEVSAELAELLLRSSVHWEGEVAEVPLEQMKVAELRAAAESAGIDHKGLKKQELIDAINTAAAEPAPEPATNTEDAGAGVEEDES